MKGHRITSEAGEFSDKFRAKELKRATKILQEADSFVLIAKKGADNNAVSCVDANSLIPLAFGCNKMEKELLTTMKTIVENEGWNNEKND